MTLLPTFYEIINLGGAKMARLWKPHFLTKEMGLFVTSEWYE
jgi:hypothetical protein